MTDRKSNTSTQSENSTALAQLAKAVSQNSFLCILVSEQSEDDISQHCEAASDKFNNYELAADLMNNAYQATENISGELAATPEHGDLQLLILYLREHYRLLREKVGRCDFDRCAVTSLAEMLALELDRKVQRFIELEPLQAAA